jgi:hypothetical protein
MPQIKAWVPLVIKKSPTARVPLALAESSDMGSCIAEANDSPANAF